VLSYKTDGQILTFIVTGRATSQQRAEVFSSIRADPDVPNGAPLLLDVRAVSWSMEERTMWTLFRMFRAELGAKLSLACAVLSATAHRPEHRWFQEAADESGLRVGIFDDEADARVWLSGYANRSG
jgi:hypothetical protein